MARSAERGETLIEVVMTIIVISISVAALLASLATASLGGKSQRDSAGTDTVMRNYAEAIKEATNACTDPGTYTVSFTPPSGYSASADSALGVCPAVTTTEELTLSVTGPAGVKKTMQIKVRTP